MGPLHKNGNDKSLALSEVSRREWLDELWSTARAGRVTIDGEPIDHALARIPAPGESRGRAGLVVDDSIRVPAPATELDASKQEYSHRFPFFLPDGRHFLYLAQAMQVGQTGGQEVCIGSLESKERRSLLRANSNPVFAPAAPGAASGHILFLHERTLLAQPFDARRLRLSGEAFAVGEQVQYFANFGFGVFTASDNGILAYQAGGAGGGRGGGDDPGGGGHQRSGDHHRRRRRRCDCDAAGLCRH